MAEVFARGPVACVVDANPLRDYNGGIVNSPGSTQVHTTAFTHIYTHIHTHAHSLLHGDSQQCESANLRLLAYAC